LIGDELVTSILDKYNLNYDYELKNPCNSQKMDLKKATEPVDQEEVKQSQEESSFYVLRKRTNDTSFATNLTMQYSNGDIEGVGYVLSNYNDSSLPKNYGK
jgi:hypothetical protein